MTAEELDARVARFLNWTYRFEFENGVSTPLANRDRLNRQQQRSKYLFDRLLDACGGTLAGKRVLDLGCGPGFWALLAAQAGAEHVLAIDLQEMRLEQAALVFEAAGIPADRYEIRRQDVFDAEDTGNFDVVLCLSVFDETARPVELFARIAAAQPQLALVESELAPVGGSYFEVSPLPPRKARLDRSFALLPSRAAFVEMAEDFGFRALALQRNMTDFTGLADYKRRRRLGFVCTPGESPALPAEEPWQYGLAALPGALRRLAAGA